MLLSRFGGGELRRHRSPRSARAWLERNVVDGVSNTIDALPTADESYVLPATRARPSVVDAGTTQSRSISTETDRCRRVTDTTIR
jgi:hypothetical protein